MDCSAKQQWQAELLAVCCDRSQRGETGLCHPCAVASDSVKAALAVHSSGKSRCTKVDPYTSADEDSSDSPVWIPLTNHSHIPSTTVAYPLRERHAHHWHPLGSSYHVDCAQNPQQAPTFCMMGFDTTTCTAHVAPQFYKKQ